MPGWPAVSLRQAGNCRGCEREGARTEEYLVSLGIAADRMLAVSKGEESPVCSEMTEDCYTRNRRGHFVFTAK